MSFLFWVLLVNVILMLTASYQLAKAGKARSWCIAFGITLANTLCMVIYV